MARNGILFAVNNTLSSHTDNGKNKFLILGEGPTYGINGSFGSLDNSLKVHSKVWDIFGKWNSFNNYEKCFLFHLESSFHSQDI